VLVRHRRAHPLTVDAIALFIEEQLGIAGSRVQRVLVGS
jgi:hypothetical protein